MDLGNPPDAQQREIFATAFAAGDFGRAFGAYQLALIRRALAVLGQEQYSLDWHREPSSTFEFAAGMAVALERLIDEDSESTSYKLIVVRDVIAAVARMQELLEGRHPENVSAPDILAELLLQGVRLGNVEVMLGQTEGGFIDEYAGLKWQEVQDYQRRQKAAASTNDKRASKRLETLRSAQEIVKINPTLTNDELAHKLKISGQLEFATRTIVGWLRKWRLGGQLPPLR